MPTSATYSQVNIVSRITKWYFLPGMLHLHHFIIGYLILQEFGPQARLSCLVAAALVWLESDYLCLLSLHAILLASFGMKK